MQSFRERAQSDITRLYAKSLVNWVKLASTAFLMCIAFALCCHCHYAAAITRFYEAKLWVALVWIRESAVSPVEVEGQ